MKSTRASSPSWTATFIGEGPGPRCMDVYERGLMLAGADQVAVDATIARLMGLDPFEIPFLRLAHERAGWAPPTRARSRWWGVDPDAVGWQARTAREDFRQPRGRSSSTGGR